ncbi:MAG: sporulation initiation factor Spo0A C-terminal domain-containing protein [Oscillospiraceae bacterium]|nr:sporulation initiation factor Spo0A C-terminal domain-containing protein [Oscillospiraceae bacterium]
MTKLENKVDMLIRLCTTEDEEVEAALKELLLTLPVQCDPEADTSARICRVLRELGIPEHLSGYVYLVEAIELVVKEQSYLRHITTALYPDVARKYHSTPSRIERAIRHAIETAWSRCDLETLTAYFGNTVSPVRGKPVNSEFIARVSNAVRQEG